MMSVFHGWSGTAIAISNNVAVLSGRKPHAPTAAGRSTTAPFSIAKTGAVVFDTPGAFDAHQHPRLIFGANMEWHRALETPQSEMRTIDEPLAHGWLNRFHHRSDGLDGPLREVDAGQRRLGLQRARVAGFRIDMVPVIEPERNVAIFLNLEHHDAIAKRMNGAGPR